LPLPTQMQPTEKDECECGACCKRLAEKMIVGVVILLISFGFLSFWYLIIIPWALWESTIGLCSILVFHIAFCFLCVSYYCTITTPPGVATNGWVPTSYTEEEMTAAKQKEDTRDKYAKFLDIANFYKPRWCHYCQSFKPPRAYHCRDIDKCVLRMDHYCPWVYNCVGYRNHKFFVLFLFYASFCLTFLLICSLWRFLMTLVHTSGKKEPFLFSAVEIVLLIMQMVLNFPVTFCIGGLWIYQLSLVFSNCTSVEAMAHDSYKNGAKKKGNSIPVVLRLWYNLQYTTNDGTICT